MDKKGKTINSYWVDVLHQPMSPSTSFAPPSFPTGLVKTESDFRSVEVGLERWRLVVAVVSVDAYPFLLFSYLTCHLEDMGIGDRYRCFLVALCPLMVRRPNLEGSSDQETSPSAGKNPGVVLVPCSLMEVHSYSYFWWCGYFWGLWVSFVMTDDQWGSQKLLQQLVSHELTTYLSIFNLFELN